MGKERDLDSNPRSNKIIFMGLLLQDKHFFELTHLFSMMGHLGEMVGQTRKLFILYTRDV
jgi:hypothetical protein